jgi:MoaA/NifB/PqqE/SkfB family radical SAM enzyme
MPGTQLPVKLVRDLIDDAKAMGIWNIRFYGGEPLLHPRLPEMVQHAVDCGIQPYVTTNAILLEQKIDALYASGLRRITIGFYGTEAKYDAYVQRRERFKRVEAGIAAVRERYGLAVDMRINWLLMRPSCSLKDLDEACRFAERYHLRIQVDLIHYSLPYFTEGPDRVLQFDANDKKEIERVAQDLIRRKDDKPELFSQSALGLRSVPDWLLKGRDMRVPCHSHQLLWVGPDGTVQQCYVTFKLGNLYEKRLHELTHTPAHRRASQDSQALRCPNCHCGFDVRVERHGPSAARYGRLLAQTRRNRSTRGGTEAGTVSPPTSGGAEG